MRHYSYPQLRRHKTGLATAPFNGKDFYFGKFGTRDAQYQFDSLLSLWLQNGKQLPHNQADEPQTAVSITDICVGYVLHAKTYYVKNGKQTSEYGNIRRAIKLFRADFGDMTATFFRPTMLKDWREKLIAMKLSRPTINKYVRHVRSVFKFAASNDHIPMSVHDNLKAIENLRKGRSIAKEPKKIDAVSIETIELTRIHLAERFSDMVQLQLLTGMRPSEVCELQIADVDTSEQVWIYRPRVFKTEHLSSDSSRVICIGPKAQLILEKYMDVNGYVFKPTRKGSGDRYNSREYRRAIHRACDRAEIPRWSPNRIRKASAELIRRVADLETAQAVLGHKSRKTTENHYAPVASKDAVEIISRIG